MLYLNHDENFQFFIFNNRAYKTGTVVKLNSERMNSGAHNNEKIWNYAKFSHRMLIQGESKYFFWAHMIKGCESNEYNSYFTISEKDLNNYIAEIIEPIEINVVQNQKKNDFESATVIIGWIIYLLSLLFSFAFKQWYLIWFWGTIIFFAWRNIKLLE